jgi:hypothetical protein
MGFNELGTQEREPHAKRKNGHVMKSVTLTLVEGLSRKFSHFGINFVTN